MYLLKELTENLFVNLKYVRNLTKNISNYQTKINDQPEEYDLICAFAAE